ncbi:RNA-binding protein 42 [Zancudomyces culisetae]|uniref:RNA-binding protein 42 n=1 Tax=Zancudomyces culisetae TaxID=1213189 RepID=A0A1R1PYZ6_ZANCU|nr:RNA-binding protein 42 [Zancudomyces culisetae]|eukprot:OMH86165.1 RNA-binding protein 42 [Zancudomyces culisetae]
MKRQAQPKAQHDNRRTNDVFENQQPTNDSTFYPLPIAINRAEMVSWRWLQDSLGYTYAYNEMKDEYYYYDSNTGIIYDYTPYYKSLGYVKGEPPALKQEAYQGANSNLGYGAVSGSTTGVESQQDEKKKGTKRKKVRAAGGEVWIDQTLDEWDQNDYRLFVGDLGTDVSDDLLHRTFSAYPSLLKTKIVRDNKTSRSKGYGFVSFSDPKDYVKAWKEMDGVQESAILNLNKQYKKVKTILFFLTIIVRLKTTGDNKYRLKKETRSVKMAKSGRSKSKIRMRNLRREKIYGPVEAERTARLAEKQKIKSGTVDQLMMDSENVEKVDQPETMEVEGQTKKTNVASNNSIDRQRKEKKMKYSKKKRVGAKKKGFKWVPQKH